MLCKICKGKRATAKHVATHGLTYDEYLKEYEKEKYLHNAAIEKINELYVTTRFKFIRMDNYGNWATITKGENRKYGLTDKDLKDHLEGKHSIGIFSMSNKSKFISFDIDKSDVEILEKIVSCVASYIPEQNIYCSRSGNKGFHVDVFFDSPIDHNVLNKFYRLVLNETGYNDTTVECRGNSFNYAVKLPLGINFKNSNSNTQYCYFVNKFGLVLDKHNHSLSFFENVEKVPSKLVYEAVEVNYDHSSEFFTEEQQTEIDELKQITALAPFNRTIEDKRESIQRLFEEGLHQEGQRHKVMYEIAVWLKEKGLNEYQIKEELIKWLDRQNKNLYKTKFDEIENELKYTLKSIFKNDYKISVKARTVEITKMEFKEILSVDTKPLRKLYFILYTHCKAFSEKDGIFYMTYEQMGQAGANSQDRRSLRNQLEKLQQKGFIRIVRSGEKTEGALKNLPNMYQIIALEKEHEIVVQEQSYTPCKKLSNNCLDCTACKLLTDKEIKSLYKKDAKVVKRETTRKCSNK